MTERTLSVQNKTNLKFLDIARDKQNKKNSKINNLISGLSYPFWVGGVVALSLCAALFVNPSKVQAAELPAYSWGNVDLAKKVVKNVTPIVAPAVTQDSTSVSLVFAEENFIQKPLVVETQITLDPPKPALRRIRQTNNQTVSNVQIIGQGEKVVGRRFPYGYCTYYVSQKRSIPWSGNAGTWLTGARSYGFATGSEPKQGAIMVTSEGGYAGHVAYVEAINGNSITISEMNFAGFGKISSRTVLAGSGFIRGYIY